LLVSTRPNSGSEAQGEAGFARRLSPLIATLGVTAVPNLLIRHQARLGLSTYELVYLLHVLAHRWDGDAWPWVPIADIARATGSAERSVRDWKAAIIAKGYLAVRKRGREGGGRGADEHDLSGLFAALEGLALEEELQRGSDQARDRLPAPRYFHGPASVPWLGTRAGRQRPRLETERVRPHESNTAGFRRIDPKRQDSAALMRPEAAAIKRPVPASEEEPGKQNLLTPPTPQGAQGIDGDQDGTVVRKPDDSFQPALPGTAAVALPLPDRVDSAEQLLVAFYRGLDSDIASLTRRQRQAKLQLARELVAAGATPAQAEAYARETNADHRRTAPVSLRSFAEERQAWLQRRGQSEASGPRLVDRTGQPPSWASADAAERDPGGPRGSTAGAIARAIVGGAS
jgi:hypothetical protein